jgi:hypothetical protein
MTGLGNSRGALFVLLAAVVVSSGCIQGSSTNLNPDFRLDYSEVDLEESGQNILQESLNRGDNLSEYSVESENRMALNLPGFSVSVNMTSDGVFSQESSDVNTSGVMGLNFAGDANSTEFTTRVRTSENGTEVVRESMGEENRTEENYSRKDLGFTLEALNEVEVENVSVLGVSNVSGEENILLDLEVSSSDLMRNSETIFQVHSIVTESTDSGEGLESSTSFNQTEAYLWTDREDRTPSKFAYYGSAENGSIQVRSVTEYSER